MPLFSGLGSSLPLTLFFDLVLIRFVTAGDASFFEKIGKTAADFPNLTWGNFFFANLLPVTIGNILGGAIMVGMVYWFVYIRKSE